MPVKHVLLLLFTFLNQLTLAQQASPELTRPPLTKPILSFFEFLAADSISEITLMSDFESIRKNKYMEDYHSGQLRFTNRDSMEYAFKVSMRSRGKSRKKVCFHPPLKLKIPKKELRKAGLNTDNKYKLVCQCKSGKADEQSLLREYLAYKIHNILSPNSFQVHLLQINYFDVNKPLPQKRFAFLLESEKSIGKRLAGKVIEREELELRQLSRKANIQTSLFQYLIGNTDWSIPALHNVKLLLQPKDSLLTPLSYDYDYSGLVNAHYAIANPDYPIRTITDRYFLTTGCTREEILEALSLFHEKKEAILTLINEFDLLSKKSKRFANRFIGRFFEIIENPRKVEREFVKE